jgi:hypothetical protein
LMSPITTIRGLAEDLPRIVTAAPANWLRGWRLADDKMPVLPRFEIRPFLRLNELRRVLIAHLRFAARAADQWIGRAQ